MCVQSACGAHEEHDHSTYLRPPCLPCQLHAAVAVKRVHVVDPGSASRAHGQSSDKVRSGLPGLLAIALAVCHWCVHRYMCHARTCPLIQKIAFSVGNGRRSRATAFTCQFQVLPAGVKRGWRSAARADEETRRSDEVHTRTYTRSPMVCSGATASVASPCREWKREGGVAEDKYRGQRSACPICCGRRPSESGRHEFSAISANERLTCHRMRAVSCTERK